jgi:7-keto-8-aminopelargonate synthetase-like enzyme
MRTLRSQIAHYFGTQDARVVASGYLSDMMLAQTLSPSFDVAFVDEKAHYSVYDGLRVTGKPMVPFGHRDPDDLRSKIAEHLPAGGVPLVMSDGVFPVTGTIAPADAYADVLGSYDGGILCIDDSHGVGVLGEHGRGTYDHFGLVGPRYVFGATLSKAFGALGGFVTGTQEFIDDVVRSDRIPEGASPLSIGAVAAAAEGLRVLETHPELRATLRSNVSYLRAGLAELGIETPRTPVPIVCIVGRDGVDLKHVAATLWQERIVVSHIGPNGYSDSPPVDVLRIAVFSGHTEEQLDRLLQCLSRAF